MLFSKHVVEEHQDEQKEVIEMIMDIDFTPVDLGSSSAGGMLQQLKGDLSLLNLIKS